MSKQKMLLVACAAVILGLVAVPRVNAWTNARHTTYLTFSAPFALPGLSKVIGSVGLGFSY